MQTKQLQMRCSDELEYLLRVTQRSGRRFAPSFCGGAKAPPFHRVFEGYCQTDARWPMIRRVQRTDLARAGTENLFSEPLGSPELHPTMRGLAPV